MAEQIGKLSILRLMKANRAIKITSIVCLGLIIVALIGARNAPATGYEPSIYASTPTLVWSLFAIVILCGIVIIVHQVFTERSEHQNAWLFGLFLILLACTAILSLYILRGYLMWGRGDFSSHLGIIKDILYVGHFYRDNYYPVTHIYIAELSLVLDVLPLIISKLLMPVLFPFYVVTMFLLSKFLLPNRGQAILAAIATTTFAPFLSGWLINPVPNHLANMLLPLALFLFLEVRNTGTSNKIGFSILFLILLSLIPMMHPVPTIALLLMLLVIGLPQLLFVFSSKHRIEFGDIKFKDCINLLLLLFVWGFTWFSSFYFFDQMVINIATAVSEGTKSRYEILLSGIEFGQKYGYSATEQFFRVYGGMLLFVILTTISLPILISRKLPVVYLRRLGSFWNLLAVMVLVFLLLYSTNIELHPTRFFPYLFLLCTIYVGFVLYEMLSNKWFSRFKNRFIRLCPPFAVGIILALSFLSGILNFYSSPFRLEANNQVTRSELTGMSWFFDNRNTVVSLSTIYTSPDRFADMLLSGEKKRAKVGLSSAIIPPYHFGYDEFPTLGNSYMKDSYILLAKIDRDLYTYVWPEVAEFRWLPSDFERLEIDDSLDKLYSNGGLDIWYVRAARHTEVTAD